MSELVAVCLLCFGVPLLVVAALDAFERWRIRREMRLYVDELARDRTRRFIRLCLKPYAPDGFDIPDRVHRAKGRIVLRHRLAAIDEK